MNQSIPDSEQKLEHDIQAKGLNAPRLSPTMISEQIISEAFYVFPETTLTICCLVLRNGYCVVGESAAASIANFDAEIGRRIARDNARQKIWTLEGYLLKEKLYETRSLSEYYSSLNSLEQHKGT